MADETENEAELSVLRGAAAAAFPHFPYTSADVGGKRWFVATQMSDLPGAAPDHKKLFQWAYLGGWQGTLARMVKNEYWGERLFVLTNYIQQTFARLLRECKVYVHGDGPGGDGDMVVFNTGLVTRTSVEAGVVGGHVIIGVLTRRPMGTADGKQWGFMVPARSREENTHADGVFVTEADLVTKARFHGCPPPQPAVYTRTREDLVWSLDTDRAAVRVDESHLLDTRNNHFKRLPKKYHDMPRVTLSSLVKGAVSTALCELATNHRLAVPQYYRNTVQLLLPLCLEHTERADVALVMRRDTDTSGTEHYTVKTWLRLSWAYLNARLLAPVDQAWLREGLRMESEATKGATQDDMPEFAHLSRSGAGETPVAKTSLYVCAHTCACVTSPQKRARGAV